ncbi:MAG: hypothetical protein J6Y58_11165 [Clostridiales bacterium]|nr:hypothetical protein [Clostridiales bacterium]
MRPVKCTNDHFFDADKFASCPQCGAAIKMSNSSLYSRYEEKNPKQSHGRNDRSEEVKISLPSGRGTVGFYSPKKDDFPQHPQNQTPAFKEPQQAPSYPQPQPAGAFQQPRQAPSYPQQAPSYPQPAAPAMWNQPVYQEPVPQAMPVQPSYQQPVMPPMQQAPSYPQQMPVPSYIPPAANPPKQEEISRLYHQDSVVEMEVPDEPKSVSKEPHTNSIAEEIKKVSPEVGKTIGYFSMPDDKKSEGGSNNSQIADPVVGWFICLKGPNYGESFSIYAGKNSLGRSHSNRICISKDGSVSREKHAWVIYEPKKRCFFIQPGEASGLIYVDGNIVMNPTEIRGTERIDIGNTTLKLIPLCGEDFSWEMVPGILGGR